MIRKNRIRYVYMYFCSVSFFLVISISYGIKCVADQERLLSLINRIIRSIFKVSISEIFEYLLLIYFIILFYYLSFNLKKYTFILTHK